MSGPPVPNVPDDTPQSQRPFLAALRQAVMNLLGQSGDASVWAVRRGELTDIGIVNAHYTTAGTPIGLTAGTITGSYTPPDTSAEFPTDIAGLSVSSLFAGAFVSWTQPTYTQAGGHSHVEVYSATGASASFGSAIQVGTSNGTAFADPGNLGVTRRYWVKAVAKNGNKQASPTGPVNVTIGLVGNADLGTAIVQAANLASGAVTPAKFQSGTYPVFFAASLPTLPDPNYPQGTVIVLTTTNKVYRSTGSTWTTSLDGADIVANSIVAGQVGAGGIVAGTITAASGVIANAAIQDAMIDRASVNKLQVVNGDVVSLSAGKLTAGSLAVGENIQSTGFSTGVSGWQITGSGAAEFGSVAIRDVLTLQNSQITISGGAINGIGTGNGTTVANSSIAVSGGAITGIGTGTGTVVANSSIAVSGGAITGIGTGNGTAVDNTAITISSGGVLSGAGGGTVTITGLGYSGALNATAGATWGVDLASRPTELTDGRVPAALNASGVVISKVIPGTTASPGSAGLYLGSDFMGYWNGSAWKTYTDNSGHFYLGGTSGSLTWDGTTLNIVGGGTFSGALSAATGTFAGSLSAATGTFSGSLSAATGTFTGTLSAGTVTGSLLQTATSGDRIVINNASDNTMKVYSTRGGTSGTLVAQIGNSISGGGGLSPCALFGESTTSGSGILSYTGSGYAGYFDAGTNGVGVVAHSTNFYAMVAYSTGTQGQIRLVGTSAPSGGHGAGSGIVQLGVDGDYVRVQRSSGLGTVLDTNHITVSSSGPSGGGDGDIWIQT